MIHHMGIRFSARVLDESGVDPKFSAKVVTDVGLVTEHKSKQAVYNQLKNVIIPKAKEDLPTAYRMLQEAITEAS